MSFFYLNYHTEIKSAHDISQPIKNAIAIFRRDLEKTTMNSQQSKPNKIVVNKPSPNDFSHAEQYSLTFNDDSTLIINGSDELGVIYALLYLSQEYLDIDPFWYWADMEFKKKSGYEVPLVDYVSSPFTIKYRGWFVNDEVFLIGWKKELGYPPTEEVWRPVFETLLRLGGNMVLPGTDLPLGIQEDLAADYGLYLTHHHAQPLGAEMFKRAFPDKKASYKENSDLYIKLWTEAIQRQKDKKVVWALSFRGQGDAPFWESDPEFNTPEKQGELISEVLRTQYSLIKDVQPDAVCSVNLYGEISELYKNGFISLPEDVIKIWADNGFGKMVSRRNGNTDNRISSMPENEEKEGVYYHITFHDLQASNHITMFPNRPELVKNEFDAILNNHANDYLLLNVGNIRMHTYFIDLVANIWKDKEVSVPSHLSSYVDRLFNSSRSSIKELLKDFHKASFSFGEQDDQHAGDQVYHFTARRMIAHVLSPKRGEPLEKLYWLTGKVSFKQQVNFILKKATDTLPELEHLVNLSSEIKQNLSKEEKTRFNDLIGFQIDVLYSSCRGLIHLLDAILDFKKEEMPVAFVKASKSLWDFEKSLEALKQCEHGKWQDFYRADWLTNIELTCENVSLYRGFLRIQGDQVVYFNWYKEYLMPDTEKHIYLENTHRNPLSDDDLALRLKEYFKL
ncbi:hypothetical protein GCM10008932_21660 [Alkalibacterium iburiense]|uniref:Glycosyl hydrolase family 115 n=2 Tax=Alkalibacterium iburiense TaxID=290589 RepID=A0ABN0XQ17_9LACT